MQLTKTAEAAGALNIYLYILMDAKLNLEDMAGSSPAVC